MASTRELWCVISGKSSLSAPDIIAEELDRYKDHLRNGIDFYKQPNSSSEAKVKSTDSVKRKDFILKLSKLLNLDEWQTHELFQNYLRMDFRGSGPQLQAILKHDIQCEGFLMKVLEFYFKERSFLLKCIKYLVSYWQDETCLFQEKFAKVVDEFANENVISRFIKQLKHLFKQPAMHNGIKGNLSAQTEFAHQLVEEQCDLVEIIFLYYKDFEMSPDVFIDLANFFRCQHFGFSQVNRKQLGPASQELCERFGYMSSLVLLEALDLDLLRKTINGHESPDATEHSFLANQIWKKVDELLYTWDDVVQQGPVLMAWTIFRHTCLTPDCQQLTKLFGDSAMRCNLIPYLNDLLSYHIFDQENDPLAGLVKAYVYILLSLMLSVFHEDTLGNYQIIVSIGCKVLAEPALSTIFFTQDQAEGIGILVNSSRKCFPFAVCSYLDLLKSLCTSPDTSELVFQMMEKQTTLAELFGKNSVNEIEASDMENIWKRRTEKILLQSQNDSIILHEGTYGKVLLHQQETRVIRWSFNYSGWLYLMLQLNNIADNPMTSCSDAGENGTAIAISIIQLVSGIIKHDPTKIEDLEPIISVLFRLIRRVSMMQSPPLGVLSASMKCLQLVVHLLPLQTWPQLVATKFLPHPKQLVGSSSGFQFEAGLYGVLLHQVEIPSADFILTKEYVSFVLQFLHGLSALEENPLHGDQLESMYKEVSVNVVFILKEILSNFGRWRYSNVHAQKQKIGLLCFEICHLLMSANFENIIPRDSTRNLPSLRSLIQEGLLFQNGGEAALLSIISVGVDNIDDVTTTKIRYTTDVVQLIKLSFAVLNLLLRNNSKNVDVSPLEDVLRQQHVMQTSELDFIQKFTKVTLFSVIAKYIYHRLDPKLPILATMVLSALAARFPLVLTASFGDSLIGVRNAFVNRLNGRVEAVRLKVAIIEFLTTCVETQPGIIESFCHITSVGKEKTLTFGKFSCILPIMEYIDCKQQFDVLSSASLEFIAALWVNRYDVAMTLIKKNKSFWKIVTSPLLELHNCQAKKTLLEIITHILNIISFETYYVKSDEFDDELRKNLKGISDCKCYEKIGKLITRIDDDKAFMVSQHALVKAWKIYVTVMIKVEPCVCGLEEQSVINQIFCDVITAMKSWIKYDGACSMTSELAELCLTLTCRRSMFLTEPGKILHDLNVILHELMTSDVHTYEVVQTLLYSAATNVLRDRKDDVCEKDGVEYLSLAENICKWLQFYGNEIRHQQKSMEFLVVVGLLNEITHSSPANHVQPLNVIFKEHGTMYNLINRLDMSFKENINFEETELILTFIMTCSQKQQLAEHLCNCGIAKFLCLSVKSVAKVDQSQDKLVKLWALVIGISSRLLKVLRHIFLHSTINFIGTHKETILQSMNIMQQVVEDRLFSAEQAAIFCYEIAQYSNDISFALPDVFHHLRFGMTHMVRLSVALLGRQKLLNHLLECKTVDNIEPLLNRTKTASPTSFRSDSTKSAVTNDAVDGLSPDAELVQNRLINITCYLVGALRRLTPNVIESILDEGMDIDSFLPLVDLDFKSPSLENNSSPSFGTLVSCLNISLKLVHKMSLSDSDRTTPDKDFSSVNLPDTEKKRALLWCIIDNALVVLLSQASCYLRHPNIDERGKQFLKRELGTELSNFLHAVHRLRTRRGIPPSPIQYDKPGLIPPSIKRSPSKLSTSFLEEEENSFFKLIDIYTKNLLR